MKNSTHFTTNKVQSKDGTLITYRQCGTGQGIIVLPGALATAKDFDRFAAALGRYFTVYTVNRRGRAGIEQGADYSVSKEIDDVAAVQRATHAQFIFGHSFGGFLALEYAREHMGVRGVIVYEPGVSVNNSITLDWAPAATSYLAKDRPLEAFVEFVCAMNPDSAKAPRWLLKAMLRLFIKKTERLQKYALLPGTIKEHGEEVRLNNTYPGYKAITANVLLLRGGKSNATTPAFKAMRQYFPTWQAQTYPKLDHFGPEKAPQVIASAVQQFAVKQ